ncbi:MAG: hypothetical protein ACREQZ_03620, partial [Woeseiaceae bacterium]
MICKLLPYLWLLTFFYLLAIAHNAYAQTPCPTGPVPNDAARVCWTNPTANVDGSSIPATGPAALKSTDIYRSLCNADDTAGATIQTITVLPTIGVVLFEGLPPGRHCFRARVTNNAGVVSASSATGRKTTTAPAPPKPRQPN